MLHRETEQGDRQQRIRKNSSVVVGSENVNYTQDKTLVEDTGHFGGGEEVVLRTPRQLVFHTIVSAL